MGNTNYRKYPNHYYEPEKVAVGARDYQKYFIRFSNLYEIYNLLKSNPEINYEIFPELASLNGTYNFAGIPYDEALEDLVNFDEKGYIDFLDLNRDLANVKLGYKHEYELIRTLAGGHLNIPAYSAGSPLCYESYERVKRPKFINIHSTLSYLHYTTKNQFLNKAIILLSLISALEKNGYNVNLNTFELSDNGNELLHIAVNVKKFGERINYQTLYKTNCHVEFLRRILFRILETSAVQNEWGNGYGHTCDAEFTKKVLNVSSSDLYFGTPSELNISGEDLAEDFESCLNTLDLKTKFDVREISDEFKEKVKRIIK